MRLNRKEDLVKATQAVIVNQGSNAVTIRAIASEAGVSAGTVLYHFPEGIEQIRFESLQRVLQRMYDDRLAIVASDRSVEHKLLNLIEVGVPDSIDPDLASVYLDLPRAYHDEKLAAVHRDLIERQVGLYRSVIYSAQQSEYIDVKVDADEVARNIIALEDAYDLYPLIGMECGGTEARRQRIINYVQLALGVTL